MKIIRLRLMLASLLWAGITGLLLAIFSSAPIQAQSIPESCKEEYKTAMAEAEDQYNRTLERADALEGVWQNIREPIVAERLDRAIAAARLKHTKAINKAAKAKNLRYKLAQGEYNAGLITEGQLEERKSRADHLYNQEKIIADTILGRDINTAWDEYAAHEKHALDMIRRVRQSALPNRYRDEQRALQRLRECIENNGGAPA